MNSDLIGRHQILNTYLYMATQTAATSEIGNDTVANDAMLILFRN